MRPPTPPLDPDSEGGKAAAEALTNFLASVELRLATRRRRKPAEAATGQRAA